jgi:uncharacterized protein YkwD
VHHRSPASSPRLPRVTVTARRRPARRRGRLATGAVLSLGVTGVLLAVPVVSSSQGRTAAVSLDSSSSSTAARTTGTSPVVLGVDGGPVTSSIFAGVGSATSSPSRAAEATDDVVVAAPGTTAAPAPSTEPPAPAPAPETTTAAPETTQAAEPAPSTSAAPPPAPAAAPAAASGPEQQVLALVNQERAAAGCGEVSADAGLAAVARAHSADMRDRGFFDHVNLDGLDPFARADAAGISARAENIARGQADAAAVMTGWMNSAGHRANILDCSLTRLGVGVAEGSGGPWWTQLFA